jgi:signal transduction histidine kinase
MSDLIDDLLRLSRISRAELELEPVDIAALVRAALVRLSSAEPQREVDQVIEPAEPVQGDLGLLGVLVENLLSNAWKYSSRQPLARIEFRSYLDEQGRRVFCVSDNGTGFDERYADRLFKPFSRLHGDHEFPGVGIGLATAQRIVQRHGGQIWARSRPGAGTQMYFTLGNS